MSSSQSSTSANSSSTSRKRAMAGSSSTDGANGGAKNESGSGGNGSSSGGGGSANGAGGGGGERVDEEMSSAAATAGYNGRGSASSNSSSTDVHMPHQSKKTNLSGASSVSPAASDSMDASMTSIQPGESSVNLKMLIPSAAAGAIIGKGGETIADLQKRSGARIKISKSNDYYPGTTERVCLITGSRESITQVVEFMNEKIREKPDPHGRTAIDFDNKVPAEREKQVKLLIPNSTAGMIIGKGGSFIRQIKDESGAFIQLSQKSKETTLPERVVTIIGDSSANLVALSFILAKVEEDPQSGSCLNISYSEIQGLVANFNPTGSPYAQNGTSGVASSASSNAGAPSSSAQTGEQHMDTSVSRSSANSPFVLPLSTGGSLSLSLNVNPTRPPSDPSLMSQYLAHIGLILRSQGYTEAAAEEISGALRCLASHGVLVINLNTAAPGAVPTTTTTAPPILAPQQAVQTAARAGSGPPTLPPPAAPAPHPQPPIAAAPVPPPPFVNHGAIPPGVPRVAVPFQHELPPPSHHAAPPIHPSHQPQQPPPPSQATFGVASVAVSHAHPVPAPAPAPAPPQPGYSRYWNSTGEQPQPQPQQPIREHHHQPEAPRGRNGSPATSTSSNQGGFTPGTPFGSNNNSFGLGTGANAPQQHHTGAHPPPPGAEEPIERAEIEINENIIGAVIGPSGRHVVDIQQFSGARVQISKKGTFSPGTRNRIVSIAGSQEAIATARYLIEQKVEEETTKRERNASSTAGGGGATANNSAASY